MQVASAVPEVHVRQLTGASRFLILACDGIWEVLSDQEVRPRLRLCRALALPSKPLLEPVCSQTTQA